MITCLFHGLCKVEQVCRTSDRRSQQVWDLPWPRGTFVFFVCGSRFAVICASRFTFLLRGWRFVLRDLRFAAIFASHFTFVLRGSRFLIRGLYFLVRASQFAVRGLQLVLSSFAVYGPWP